jgi:hypothetical protein
MHRVSIAEHEVGRWRVAETVLELPAVDVTQARIQGAREAHRQAGIPAWLPLLRRTYLRTSAVSIEQAPRRAHGSRSA